MSSPVWVLSVDLQTKTATFESGMTSAARSARSAFGDIRSAAMEGGEGVARSATNMRAAIGLVDNTIRGNHAAAMADLVREFKDSSIVMAALPFAAVVGGIAAIAGIAIEVALKVKEWREEQSKLNDEQMKFGTAVQESFSGLDAKILQAELRADELRNDHLGALRKELQLIDHASMQDLVHEIETIAKAADPVFKMLEGHWYTWGIGSAGASHALEQFKNQYDSLLSQGKDKEASDLLAGTLTSAKSILAAQQQAKANSGVTTNNPTDSARVQNAFQSAYVKLKAAGVEYTDKEIQSQQILIKALSDQITSEGKIAELKKADSANATTQTGNEESGRRAEAARAAATSQLAIAQQTLTADKAMADARLEIQNASVAQRLASDLSFAARDLEIKSAANAQEIAALDKAGKDYQNQLKSLQEKEQELTAQHAATVAGLQSRASVEQYKRDITALEQSEREKIDATKQGSSARLAAIDAATREAEAKGLQETDFYRQLGMQRVETVRQAAEQESKDRADAAREEADNTIKTGQLIIAAAKEQQALQDSSRRVTDQQRVREELAVAEQEFQLKQQAYKKEAAALEASGKDDQNKLKALQDKEKQLVREHENEITAIKDQAMTARNSRILAADTSFQDSMARNLTKTLMANQTFGTMMTSIGNQVVSGMLENALKSIMADDMTKEKDAAAAARKMYLAGSQFPFPANIVMGPVLAAGAFASVMAFNSGTDSVPGYGNRDTVPALLTPTEGVVPGGVMDGLRKMARDGTLNGGGGQTVHVHVRPTYHLQALDGHGVEHVLKSHTATLTKHFHSAVRKANR